MWKIVCVLIAVIVGIFLRYDADLSLVFLPYKVEGSFAGQVVWIAGASSGIGASLAADMVKAGAQVIISARRLNNLEEVADTCAKYGTRPVVVQMDMTDSVSQQQAFDAVIKKFGHIDSLVLNSGQSQRNIAVATPIEETQQLMNLNFMSYVTLTKLVAPTMIARHQGQV